MVRISKLAVGKRASHQPQARTFKIEHFQFLFLFDKFVFDGAPLPPTPAILVSCLGFLDPGLGIPEAQGW